MNFKEEIFSLFKWAGLSVAFAFLIVAIWLGANVYRQGEASLNAPLPSHCDFTTDKYNKLKAIQGPKWVVYGFSNTLYGILAERMSARLGVRIYNFSAVATLPPSVSMEYLKKSLSAGDVVILDIPYWLLAHGYQKSREEQSSRFAFECDLPFFWQATNENKLKFLFDQDPLSVALAGLSKASKAVGVCLFDESCIENHFYERECQGSRAFENGKRNILCAISKRYGDLKEGNEAYRRTPETLEQVTKEHQGLENQGIWTEGFVVQALSNFIGWAHENGVRTVAVPPPGWWPEKLRNNNITSEVVHFYEARDVPFLGEPLQFFWDVEKFYDTNNHLNRKAMIQRTDILSDILARHFQCELDCAK